MLGHALYDVGIGVYEAGVFLFGGKRNGGHHTALQGNVGALGKQALVALELRHLLQQFFLGRAGKQRGNSASKDQYLMFTFSISFQLKTYKCPTYLKQGYLY